MSKKILFTETYFECGAGGVSVPKFQAGSRYPVDAETLRHVTLGRAVEVDAEEEPAPESAAVTEPAPTPADTAQQSLMAEAPAEPPAEDSAPAPAPTQAAPRQRRSA